MKTKSLTFAALLMCLSVTAQTIEQYYDLNNTIWRFIELTNYGCSAARITEIAGNIPSDIIIPDNVSAGEDNYLVTEIGEHVFSDRVIETISIPSSVCVIGYNAFYGCSTMWAVMTPSMEDWCKLWFNGYYSNPIRYATYLYVNGKAVRDVVIPESVTSLHSYAFAGYSELRTVKFHEQLTSIGQFAFENCKNMTFEKLPDNLSSIGSSAFHGCKALTSLIIPEGVVSIGDNCFTGCTALTSVVIPSSVTSIGNYAFAGTKAETMCFHNKNCDNVGYWLDAPYMEPRTSIQKIVFGKEVTNISFNFFGIFSEYMEVEEGNSIYDSRDGCNAVIETATNTLVAASANTVIPNTVVSIGRASFYGSSIESITIPRSVKDIGMNAFYDCNSLTKVVVESEEPIAIEEYVFSNQANATLYVPAGCKAAYEAAANWKDFKEIVEMGGSEDIDDTDISQIDNVIYNEPMEVKTGSQATISLKMKNSAAIRAFQFDLYLPEGVSAMKSSKGKIQGALSAGRLPDEDEHTLAISEQPDGAVRFLCNSQYDETFTGNDGEIATLLVNIADDIEDGDYPIVLKDQKLTETDISHYYTMDFVQSKLTVVSYVLGDINSDGKVDVSDYVGVANHILGIAQEGFNEKASDVNEDGVIDVSDYVGVANIILTGSIYGSNKAMTKVSANTTH